MQNPQLAPSPDHPREDRVAMQIQKSSTFSSSPLFHSVSSYEAKFWINWLLWVTLSDHIKWGALCQETAKTLDPAQQKDTSMVSSQTFLPHSFQFLNFSFLWQDWHQPMCHNTENSVCNAVTSLESVDFLGKEQNISVLQDSWLPGLEGSLRNIALCRKIHYEYRFSAWETLPRWGSARHSSVPDPVSEPLGRQLRVSWACPRGRLLNVHCAWVKKYSCLRNLLTSHSDGFNVSHFCFQWRKKRKVKSKLRFVLLQNCLNTYKAFKAKADRAYPFNAILSELLSCHAGRNGDCGSAAEISDTVDIKWSILLNKTQWYQILLSNNLHSSSPPRVVLWVSSTCCFALLI